LPRLSGLEVLRHLRRTAETAEIPVVVVSGLSGKNRAQLIEEGADDYLEKNDILPDKGVNLLPKVLEDVMCRIGRKHGVNFKQTPTLK
jgi:CheY-like chemotaxis protein